MAALVLEYYLLLRSVLRAKHCLRACLTRCGHCGIFFLTDPRNAGRRDLRCPFGCRAAHRQQQSTRRSVAYYRDPAGRKKKSALNSTPGQARGSWTPTGHARRFRAPAWFHRVEPGDGGACADGQQLE